MNALRSVEQTILKEGQEHTRRLLAAELQKRIDEIGALSPCTGLRLEEVSYRPLLLDTAVGRLQLKAAYGYCPAQDSWVTPARVAWGMKPYQRVSPELEARVTETATACGSYQKAARMATLWGTPVSDDLVHAHVQTVGQRLVDNPPTQGPGEVQAGKFSMVLMLDGWMVRERGKDWGKKRRRPKQIRVKWHEVKSAVLFRLEDQAATPAGRGWLIQKHVVVREPETEPVVFGQAVHAEASRQGLAQAQEVYMIMDGAVWLWNLRKDRFCDSTPVLDFHHASQHLWALAHHLYGEKSEEQKAQARAWVEPLLHQLRHGKENRALRTLEELLTGANGRHKVVKTEVNYFREHKDHLHYKTVDDRGGPIGSGAVESLCSQLQDRFKRTGQFWTRPGLRRLLAVEEAVRNRDFDPRCN
jgi:1,2-phenylacetyl-CoA epoxidase PaaB subunit